MIDFASYTKGTRRIGGEAWAYLQPDGSWGLNNTALIVSSGEALLIDTLIDLPHTRDMLTQMRAVHPAAGRVGTVFLTHWHVDHVLGLGLPDFDDSRIYASRICTDYMANLPPRAWVACLAELEGDAKRQMDRTLIGKFDFTGVKHRAVTDVFEERVEFNVGTEKVIAVETKPFHTRSDSVVFVPGRGVVHTGDLIAIDRHVGMQYPFLANLLESVGLLLSFDAEVYVTGHGPLASRKDVAAFREYLLFIQDAVRGLYNKGLDLESALDHLLRNLGPYRALRNPAALYFTVKLLYCEFAGDTQNYARRNNPEFLATQWRMSQTLPKKHPELFAQFSQ